MPSRRGPRHCGQSGPAILRGDDCGESGQQRSIPIISRCDVFMIVLITVPGAGPIPLRNADNNGDRRAAAVAPSDASKPCSQHAEQQQRQRHRSAIGRRDRETSAQSRRARSDVPMINPPTSSSTFSATTIVREIRSRVAERAQQRQLSPPFEHIPKKDRAEPERAQHQPQPAEHLKGREVSIFNAVKAREAFRAWTPRRPRNPTIAIPAVR